MVKPNFFGESRNSALESDLLHEDFLQTRSMKMKQLHSRRTLVLCHTYNHILPILLGCQCLKFLKGRLDYWWVSSIIGLLDIEVTSVDTQTYVSVKIDMSKWVHDVNFTQGLETTKIVCSFSLPVNIWAHSCGGMRSSSAITPWALHLLLFCCMVKMPGPRCLWGKKSWFEPMVPEGASTMVGKAAHSLSRKPRDHNFNYKHKAEGINWKWNQATDSQRPLLVTHFLS